MGERGAHARLAPDVRNEGLTPASSQMCTKNVEQQCPARRDGDLTSPVACTCSIMCLSLTFPIHTLEACLFLRVLTVERVCVGAKHTRTCTIAFLPLQETHYNGTPPLLSILLRDGGPRD